MTKNKMSAERARKAKPFYDATPAQKKDIAGSNTQRKRASASAVIASRLHREAAGKGYADLASGKLKEGAVDYKIRKANIDASAKAANKASQKARNLRSKPTPSAKPR